MSEELALKKLTSSGLGHIPLPLLHMEVYSAPQTAAVAPGFHTLPSLVINYMDPRSPHLAAQPLRHRPKMPPFKRYRYLVDPPPDNKGKVKRYMQPAGQGVCAYFPPLIDWNPILDDPAQRIFITEGELKAAKATSMGFHTIGLGGVSNLGSALSDCEFLPELEDINWAMRYVYICFDNDGVVKPEVNAAINRLHKRLQNLGAVCRYIELPGVQGVKVGLDDYFLTHSAADFEKLVGEALPLGYCEKLWDLSSKFGLIQTPDCVVDFATGELIASATFLKFRGNHMVRSLTREADGSHSQKEVPLASRWMTWPLRPSFTRLTYAPGQQQFLDGGCYNTWLPSGVEPKKGDVKLFKELLAFTFGKTDEGKRARDWFLQWAAYPIQNPGAKLYTCVLMWSTLQGSGKTLLGYQLGKIYGEKNYTEIGQRHLHSEFNNWAANKQFIVGDEITGSDKREVADELKSLITGSTVRINEKNLNQYVLPNTINLYLTSNRPVALYLDTNDRRAFVWEVAEKAPQEFFDAYDTWYHTDEATAAVHDYLLKVDLTGFNPRAKALETRAKVETIETGRSAHEAWIHRLKEDPASVLRTGNVARNGDLFTSQELLNIFLGSPDGMGANIKAQSFGAALKAAGFFKFEEQIWYENSSRKDRFYIVRNDEKWRKATKAQIRKHVDDRSK